MGEKIVAECACGQVRFQASQAPVLQLCCHCTDCRDATGDDFSLLAFFTTSVTVVAGQTSARIYVAGSGSETERLACAECGTVMFDKSARFPDLIGVFSRQIEPPFAAVATQHMWVESKLATTILPEGVVLHQRGLS